MASEGIASDLTDTFELIQGLKQWEVLTPKLFNLSLKYVVINEQVDADEIIFRKLRQECGYADGLNIIGSSIVEVKECLVTLEKSANQEGLEGNKGKTEMIVQTRWLRSSLEQDITKNRHNFEVVR